MHYFFLVPFLNSYAKRLYIVFFLISPWAPTNPAFLSLNFFNSSKTNFRNLEGESLCKEENVVY